jgi:hypothetical protein
MHLLDEVLQHLLGDREVRYHAVLQRADGRDVARRAAEHVLGLGADGLDLLAAARGFLAYGDHGRLVEHDALAAHVDQRIGRAKVDRQVVGEIAPEFLEHLVRRKKNFGRARETARIRGNLTIVRTFHKATCMIYVAFFPFRSSFQA